MNQEDKSKQQIDVLNQALDNPNVPKIYINGFLIGTSNADVTVLAQQNARPTAVLNMSFEIAKTLVTKLNQTIARIEKAANVNFLTTDDMDKITKELAEK